MQHSLKKALAENVFRGGIFVCAILANAPIAFGADMELRNDGIYAVPLCAPRSALAVPGNCHDSFERESAASLGQTTEVAGAQLNGQTMPDDQAENEDDEETASSGMMPPSDDVDDGDYPAELQSFRQYALPFNSPELIANVKGEFATFAARPEFNGLTLNKVLSRYSDVLNAPSHFTDPVLINVKQAILSGQSAETVANLIGMLNRQGILILGTPTDVISYNSASKSYTILVSSAPTAPQQAFAPVLDFIALRDASSRSKEGVERSGAAGAGSRASVESAAGAADSGSTDSPGPSGTD